MSGKMHNKTNKPKKWRSAKKFKKKKEEEWTSAQQNKKKEHKNNNRQEGQKSERKTDEGEGAQTNKAGMGQNARQMRSSNINFKYIYFPFVTVFLFILFALDLAITVFQLLLGVCVVVSDI